MAEGVATVAAIVKAGTRWTGCMECAVVATAVEDICNTKGRALLAP